MNDKKLAYAMFYNQIPQIVERYRQWLKVYKK